MVYIIVGTSAIAIAALIAIPNTKPTRRSFLFFTGDQLNSLFSNLKYQYSGIIISNVFDKTNIKFPDQPWLISIEYSIDNVGIGIINNNDSQTFWWSFSLLSIINVILR